MSIDFHDPNNSASYTTRSVDDDWKRMMAGEIFMQGLTAADIGCGGGIYSKALLELGAKDVIAVDFSPTMLQDAAKYCAGFSNIRFQQGDARHTGIDTEAVGVVLERALIHHLQADDLDDCFREACRILKSDGILIVQDRTPRDCALTGSSNHIRGYIFEQYPRLLDLETERRHSSHTVQQALAAAGFKEVKELQLWETRRSYDSFAEFREDLLNRTGRSILHELTDEELERLAGFIQEQLGTDNNKPLTEKDRWTVWLARKH